MHLTPVSKTHSTAITYIVTVAQGPLKRGLTPRPTAIMDLLELTLYPHQTQFPPGHRRITIMEDTGVTILVPGTKVEIWFQVIMAFAIRDFLRLARYRF